MTTSPPTRAAGGRPPGGFRRALRGVGAGGAKPQAGSQPPAARPARGAPAASRGTLIVLALPSILLLVLVNGYPFAYGLFQSVQNGSLITAGDFVGIANYAGVLSEPRFWSSALFTVLFSAVGVFGSWIVGLALALMLQVRAPGSAGFKVLLMLPWVVPIVVSSTAWNWLVATPSSPVPTIARALGLGSPAFLANSTLAVVIVCVFKVWVSFPFMMLMTSSALAAVDPTVYEASGMDGASRWQQLTQITLPIIARSTYISWILMTIFSVNDFPTIYLLTGGGPIDATTSVIVLAYRTVFQDFQTGPGVAIAFLMTAVLVVVSVLLFRQIQKVEIE